MKRWLSCSILTLAMLLPACRDDRRETPATTTTPPTLTEFQTAAAALGCSDNGFVQRNTPKIGQENGFWCWAATEQMVEGFYKRTVKQCDVAKALLAPADCCTAPACLEGGWPPFAQRRIAFKQQTGPLTARQIVNEIGCEKRPFAFSWKFAGGGGHIMVGVGYFTENGTDYVVFRDPSPVRVGQLRWVSYGVFKTGSNGHWEDFYELEESP